MSNLRIRLQIQLNQFQIVSTIRPRFSHMEKVGSGSGSKQPSPS